ncbi:GldM family protein [Mucilaginibacter ginsenosidivorax]|uniref:GldM family protein n=1 Tax=Mucilaginibacter ginsenosidivorax TaxID=862126 RepID=UPI0013157781
MNIPNSIFDAKFTITGFTLLIMSKADKRAFNTEGNQLSPQMKSAISNLKIGDKLFFY